MLWFANVGPPGYDGRLEGRWLSVDEIAEHPVVSKDTSSTWIHAKGIPAHRVGQV